MKGEIENHIPRIKQRLSLRFATVDTMSSIDNKGAEELAFKYAPKYDIVVSCGGDGTLNQVINGVKKSGADTAVGILPFGTCNDVARTLGIPLDLDKAIDCILRLNTVKYDLMYNGERYISYALATGYMTKTSYCASAKSKKKFGRFAYVMSSIKNIFKVDNLPITITANGERIHGKFVYFMLLNGNSAGGFTLNKNDDLSDGKVKLVLIKKSKGLGCIITFAKLFFRGINAIKKSKLAIVKDVDNVFIENHSNSPFVLDGEKDKFLKKHIKVDSTLEIIKG